MKNVMGNLIGIALNLWIALGIWPLKHIIDQRCINVSFVTQKYIDQRHFNVHLYKKLPSTGGGGGSGVQLPSCVRLFETPWTTACQASLILTIS